MTNNTIFDDVFRTMREKMPALVIPVINEVFHTKYPQDEPIEQFRNEHHTKSGEIITDSYLGIRDRLYHIECESRPNTDMCIRMIEYDFAIALERAVTTAKGYEINFPNSCVLYLRHNSNTPAYLSVMVNLPDGRRFEYRTPTVKVQEYTKDAIFKKRLLFFLPFYIMRYEKQLTEIGKSPEQFAYLITEYETIRQQLKMELASDQEAELYTRLIELIKTISDYILKPEPKLKEGIGDIMGGKVLELETDRILEQGIEQGRIQTIASFLDNGGDIDEAKRLLNASDEDLEKAGMLIPN